VLLGGGYYRAFFAATITTLTLIELSAVVFGASEWERYVDAIGIHQADYSTWDIAIHYGMPSIYTLLHSYGASGSPCKLAQMIGALGSIALLLSWCKEWKGNPRTALLYVSILTLFATPYLGIYDYQLAVTMIIATFFAVDKQAVFGYPMVAMALIVPFIAFVHAFAFAAWGIILAPVIMAGALWYIHYDKRLHYSTPLAA